MEWRIFFIGPMGDAKPSKGSAKAIDYSWLVDCVKKQGYTIGEAGNVNSTLLEKDGEKVTINVPSASLFDYSSHLPKLHAYLIDYLTKERGYKLTSGDRIKGATLEKRGERIITLTPSGLYGPSNIPTNVFDTIDDSDLVIADLSGNKPAVVYELAFCHALGIRTIVVGGSKERSFYFSQMRFAEVAFQDEQLSSDDLNGQIDSWLKGRNKRFDSSNPLTDFYGAPLPDISAATGLAAGFYKNFARPILVNAEIVYKSKHDGSEEPQRPAGLIVLRPKDFAQKRSEVKEALWKQLVSSFPEEKVMSGDSGEVFIRLKEDNQIRTEFFLVDGYLIDVPRTMFSLDLSPRLSIKRDKALKSKDKALRNMEGVLIERFFEAVKRYLERDANIDERMFHVGSIREIPSIIKKRKSKTWSNS